MPRRRDDDQRSVAEDVMIAVEQHRLAVAAGIVCPKQRAVRARGSCFARTFLPCQLNVLVAQSYQSIDAHAGPYLVRTISEVQR